MLRNRVAIAVAVLFVAVLLGGTAAALLQARRAALSEARATASRLLAEKEAAEAQRQRGIAVEQGRLAEMQRIAADTERKLAERRFEQVRQLAGKFLLEFHDSIASLPGSTAARKMVVSTGLEYYDTLVKEAAGNTSLLREIARGYDRLGDVQGNPNNANLGDSKGALASYHKARAIRAAIADRSPEFRAERINGDVRIGQLMSLQGDLAGAERVVAEAIALGEPNSPPHYELSRALAGAWGAYAVSSFRTGNYERAAEPYEKVLRIWSDLEKQHVNPVAERSGVASAHTRLGDTYMRMHRPEEALAHLRTAIQIDKQLSDDEPNSVPRLRKLYLDYALLGSVFRTDERLAGPGESRGTVETAARLAAQMRAADPNNSTALFDLMTAETLMGDWFRDHKDPAGSVPHYRTGVDAAEKFAATGAAALLGLESLIYAHQRLASGLGRSGRLDEAIAECGKAEEYVDRADKLNPGAVELLGRRADIAVNRAEAYAQVRRWPSAIAAYQAAATLYSTLQGKAPKNASYLSSRLSSELEIANCQAAAERFGEAARTVRSVIDGFGDLAAIRPLSPAEEERRKTAVDKAAVWAGR